MVVEVEENPNFDQGFSIVQMAILRKCIPVGEYSHIYKKDKRKFSFQIRMIKLTKLHKRCTMTGILMVQNAHFSISTIS